MIKKFNFFTENQIQLLLTLTAAFLAWRIIYIQNGWVNDDSILYFEVARLFALGEWKQGLALYNWPLYSAILAFLHKLLDINIQQGAEILNVIFFTVSTYSFIAIIRLAGGNRITMLFGALLLFSTPYLVGDVLPMLLRDQGFWAFFLLSIQFFILFYRSKKFSDALLWQVSAILAVLFRIEAATFLILLPLVLFSKENAPHRIKNWIYANSLNLLTLSLIFTAILANPNLTLKSFGRLDDLFYRLTLSYNNITETFLVKSQIINDQILGGFLDDYGMMSILLTMTAILISKCLLSPGWLASLILIFNWKNTAKNVSPDALKIIYCAISIAILNAAVILTSNFILSGRYIASLSFMMLILAAFSFTQLWCTAKTGSKTGWKNYLLILVLILSGVILINNLRSKDSEYNYEQHAVNWIKTNNSKDLPVFYTTPSARFYAKAPYAGRGYDEWAYTLNAIADGSIQNYSFLAIELKNHQKDKEQYLLNSLSEFQLVKEFMGFRSKKKVMIFVKKLQSAPN